MDASAISTSAAASQRFLSLFVSAWNAPHKRRKTSVFIADRDFSFLSKRTHCNCNWTRTLGNSFDDHSASCALHLRISISYRWLSPPLLLHCATQIILSSVRWLRCCYHRSSQVSCSLSKPIRSCYLNSVSQTFTFADLTDLRAL